MRLSSCPSYLTPLWPANILLDRYPTTKSVEVYLLFGTPEEAENFVHTFGDVRIQDQEYLEKEEEWVRQHPRKKATEAVRQRISQIEAAIQRKREGKPDPLTYNPDELPHAMMALVEKAEWRERTLKLPGPGNLPEGILKPNSALFKAPFLLGLDMSHCLFPDSLIPKQLSADSFPLLKLLDLSHNNLTCIPAPIFTLDSLVELRLNNNMIKGEITADIKALQKLRILNLAFNNITGLPEEVHIDNSCLQAHL